MAKDKDYNRMIHTARWLRLRRDKLTRNPTCERCGEKGRLNAATEVHHIIPVEVALSYREKERLMFDPTNLMAMCHDCHVMTHMEMGRSGKEQAKRRTKERLERFINKFLK